MDRSITVYLSLNMVVDALEDERRRVSTSMVKFEGL